MKRTLDDAMNIIQNRDNSQFPLSKDEVRTILDRGDQTIYQSINRQKKIKRGLKMTSIITSILMLGIFGINYLSNDPQPASVNKETAKGKQENTRIEEKGEKEISEEQKTEISEQKSDEYILKTFDEKPPEYLIKKSADFKWNEIYYSQLDNEFIGKQFFKIFNEKKKIEGAREYNEKIEFQDLIKILNILSDSLKTYNYFGMENIGHLQENAFYIQLDKSLKEIKRNSKSDDSFRMFELYAMISHKLANQSSGINFLSLSKQELENIGISTTDSSYSYQTEMIYERIPEWLDKSTKSKGFPENHDKPVLVKYSNYAYWWVRPDAQNNNVMFIDGYRDPDKSKLPDNTDTSKIYACLAQFMKDYTGWKLEDYSPICPVLSTSYIRTGLLSSPIMYFGTGALKEYIDKQNYYWKINSSWRKDGVPKDIKDSLMKLDTEIMREMDRLQNNLQANTLLPIVLPVPDTNNKKFKGLPTRNLYLMFAPTDGFLDRLPIRYRESLRKEISAMRKIESGELTYIEACKGLSDQESFFNICSVESNNIKDTKISPNPAKGESKIDFTLLGERFINIAMHDINGSFVKEILNWQKYQPSRISIDIDMKKIKTGVYLITILTDKGDKVTKRLVVE